jgi:hypothetical protein
MSDFPNFLTKAAELYLAAPLFFNWAAPIVVAIVGGLIWLAYWLGGKFADSEINGLKAQIAALDQRFNFAKDQVASSTKEATDVRSQLDKLKGQIAVHAPVEQLQNSTALLEGNLNRLLTANTAASETLTHRSTGFDEAGQLIWKPILPSAHSRARKKRE